MIDDGRRTHGRSAGARQTAVCLGRADATNLDKPFTEVDIVNMKTRTISTRMTEDELRILDELAEESGLDRSGMTRSLVRRGLKEMRTEAALNAYAGQHATLSRAAEMAALTPGDFLARLATSGGTFHYDLEEFEEDLDASP